MIFSYFETEWDIDLKFGIHLYTFCLLPAYEKKLSQVFKKFFYYHKTTWTNLFNFFFLIFLYIFEFFLPFFFKEKKSCSTRLMSIITR